MLTTPTRLHIPKLLVGRERLTGKLEMIFSNVSKGHGEIILVPGRSGVGKTSLVEWLKTPVLAKNGLFIEGKFDQYQQNSPYYAIRFALAKLWRKIQEESHQPTQGLKDSLRQAVGDLGSLLVELVPELEHVFSDQPGLEEVGIHEARHRFTGAIRRFLEVACRPDQPVVLFLDDWQWADQASLDLLRALKPANTLGFFLLIASYRDEDVDENHPFQDVISTLQAQEHPPEIIEVKSLTEEDIETFISDIFQHTVEKLNSLTRLIRDHTQGNPFYIKSLLEYLHENRQLFFDAGRSLWQWRIERETLPENIVDLFIRRLAFFDGSTRELLSFASCLGNTFDLFTLSLISSLSFEQCLFKLTPLLDRGFLTILEDTDTTFPESKRNIRFKFMHDRVQQAAFHFIDRRNFESIQLKIGRQLMASLSEKEQDDRIFEILEHLNAGSSLIDDSAEGWKMIELNMQAAKKARAATAYRAMLTFNRAAYAFALRQDQDAGTFWNTHYEVALQLSRDLAESEFVEGDRRTAEHIIEQSMHSTRTAVERAETLNIQIVHYTLLARYEEAIASGRKALQKLGIQLPEENYEEFRDREIQECRKALQNKEISSLRNAPLMTNREMQTATRLLITLGPPCYRTHQRLWSVIVPKVVKFTLEHGLIPQIGYSHTAFGGLLGWVDNDYETAREFGEVAEQIMSKRFDSPSDQSVFYLMLGSSIRHWFKHLRYASKDYLKAYDIGLRSGNMQYAAYAFGHNMYCSFYQATPMGELIRNTEQSLVFSRSRLNQWAIDLLEGGLRIFNLLSCDSEEKRLELEDDTGYLARVNGHGNIQVLCIYKILRTFSCLLLGQYAVAHDIAEEAQSLIYTVGTQGLLPWPEHQFTRFLVMTALYQDSETDRQLSLRKELEHLVEQFRIWSAICPENHHHKLLLATAELMSIDGSYSDALFHYDKAIEAAKGNDFTQWEGIANERAHHLCRRMGSANLAQVYWQQAYTCFRRLGVRSKIRLMEGAYTDEIHNWIDHLRARQAPASAMNHYPLEKFKQRHLQLLRTLSDDKLKAQQSMEVSVEADKLTQATERLRIEIAERKRQEKERLRLEEEIRHRHKMEAIGTLAGGIAHEFNNMLAIIIGNLEIVIDEVRENEDLMSCLADIQSASLRARDVVRKLLRFAQKSTLDRKPLRIRKVVEEAMELLSQSLPATIDIQLRLLCTSETIYADATEIQQVLINLCNNGVHAMSGRQGVLEVSLERVFFAEGLSGRNVDLKPGAYIQLVVNDTGIGIPENIQDRIFDPYFTTKDVDEGLGMGLAVVLGIVKDHNGAISVESKVGRGSSFRVLFPMLETVDEPVAASAESLNTATRNEHILFVDDEEAITRMNQQIIKRLGYRITTYNNPQKALDAFRNSPQSFNLVITDLTMPEMTGTELAKSIKNIRRETPVMICTGDGGIINATSAANLGVEAYLAKPITMRKLERAIRDILGKG
ncbi:MAG: AAA family ATPase [Desulforhopalus sp.]